MWTELRALGLAAALASFLPLPVAAADDPVAGALLRLAGARPGDRVVVVGPPGASSVVNAAKRAGIGEARLAKGPEEADLSSATVVVVQLDRGTAARLRPLLLIGRPGTRVVSLDGDFGDWKPDRTAAIDVPGAGSVPARKGEVRLWIVPSNMNGDWCGQDGATGAVLRISQRLQLVEGSFLKSTKTLRFEGTIDGTRIAAAAGRLALEQSGDILRVTTAKGNYAAWRDAAFARRCCGTCP